MSAGHRGQSDAHVLSDRRYRLFASDGRCDGTPDYQGFSLSLTVDNDAEAERLFNALANGGQVQMPLGNTFFASRFGMVADRFGVSWMVLTKP
jgi:PhnB protein